MICFGISGTYHTRINCFYFVGLHIDSIFTTIRAHSINEYKNGPPNHCLGTTSHTLMARCESLTPFVKSINLTRLTTPRTITTIDALQRRSKSAQSCTTFTDERKTELNCLAPFITSKGNKMVY